MANLHLLSKTLEKKSLNWSALDRNPLFGWGGGICTVINQCLELKLIIFTSELSLMNIVTLDRNQLNTFDFRIEIDQIVLISFLNIKELVQSDLVLVIQIKFEAETENLL